MADLVMPPRPSGRSPRRVVAVGVVRRGGARTTIITATAAGVSGRIHPAVTR
jgi:hypothetical protein